MSFSLNEEQLAAAEALQGTVLIRAGAGSGKTRTLAERFARALADSPGEEWTAAKVGQILTITFTDKAAGELAERVRSALRAQSHDAEARAVDVAWISTIHGFCSRVLRRHALDAGLDPAFRVADAVETGGLKQAAFEAAARSVASTEPGERLLGAFELNAVYEATETIGRALRTRSLGTGALVREAVPDASEVWADAVRLYTEATRALAATGDETNSGTQQLGRCVHTASALAELDLSEMTNVELGEEVWRLLDAWKPARTTTRTGEVRAQLIGDHAILRASAAACAAAPFAEATVRLVGEYERVYADLKAERGVLDFDDLQTKALDLFETQPAIGERYRDEFRLVMVDEFQDTDELQSRLVKMVAGPNLCTVGDEQQSIYRFRGADIDVYRALNDEMESAGGREFALVENYRSHGDVLSFVNTLFGHEALFGDRLLRLRHGRIEPKPPFVPESVARLRISLVHHVERREGLPVEPRVVEAGLIADQLAALRDEHGVDPGRVAVLLRTYKHADTYAEALRERGFETLVVGGSRFFDLCEVAILRAFVRAVANPHDEEALATVLASPLSRLSDDAVWLLRHAGDGAIRQDALWDALALDGAHFSLADQAAARDVHGLVERGRFRAGQMPLSELLLRAVEESDYDLALLAGGDRGRQGYANVLKLARLADSFEASGGAGPAAFEAYLASREVFKDHASPATLADDDTPAVRLMSIHASKGLEFPVVVIAGLGEQDPSDGGIVRLRAQHGSVEMAVRLPGEWSANQGANRTPAFITLENAEKQADLDERKRLFYVACTRAKELLILSGVGNLESERAADEAKTPGEWLQIALGSVVRIAPGVDDETVVGEAKVRVRCVDASGWEPPRATALVGVAIGPEHARADAPPSSTDAPPATEIERTVDGVAASQRLSYSDLELYEGCSLRFMAEKVLRVGKLDLRESGDPRQFGSAVHGVLQLVGGGLGAPDEERIEAIARFYRLGPTGLAALKVAVQRFLQSSAAADLQKCAAVHREWPFALRLGDGDDPFLLVGTTDAYGRSGVDGLIVDYKTGTARADDQQSEQYRLQARCYALAAIRDGCETVQVTFVRPEAGDERGQAQRMDLSFSADDVPSIEAEIDDVRRRIAQGKFEPLARWSDDVCRDCPIAGSVCTVPRPSGG